MTNTWRIWAGSISLIAKIGGLAVVAFCMTLSARAQTDLSWQEAGGGFFEDNQNWAPDDDPPGAGDTAIFNLGQDPAYTVTLLGNNTIAGFQVHEDRVILDLDGNTLGLTEPHDPPWNYQSPDNGRRTGLVLGAWGDSVLTIVNSDTASGRKTVSTTGLGFGADGYSGNLILDGATTRLHVTTDHATMMSTAADTSLTIRNGAEMQSAGRFQAGYTGSSHTATILVEGAGSELRMSNFWAGERGAVEATVRNGANFVATSETYISRREQPATLTIDNATALLANVRLGGYRAQGTLRVINGSVANAGAGYVEIGTARLSGSNTNASGVLEVIGKGSRFTQTALERGIAIGGYEDTDQGTRADLTILDGGEVTNAHNVWIHSRGTLTMSAGTLNVGNDLRVTDGVGVPHGENVEPAFNLTLHTALTEAPVNVGGDVVLGLLDLSLDLAPGFDAGVDTVFEIIRYDGTLAGTFLDRDNLSTVTHESGYAFLLDYGSNTDDVVTLQVTMIPEPGTLLLLLAGAGLLAVRRRV